MLFKNIFIFACTNFNVLTHKHSCFKRFSKKMTFSGTISNCPVCRSNVRIIANVQCQLLPYSIFLLYAILYYKF